MNTLYFYSPISSTHFVSQLLTVWFMKDRIEEQNLSSPTSDPFTRLSRVSFVDYKFFSLCHLRPLFYLHSFIQVILYAQMSIQTSISRFQILFSKGRFSVIDQIIPVSFSLSRLLSLLFSSVLPTPYITTNCRFISRVH